MILIPETVRNLWNGLEMRLLVLLSLFLQILLIFFAAFRKRSGNKLLSFLLWASYLGADYIATLGLGNLLSKQTEYSEQGVNGDLVALWAPFLLLHLGGPDAITSYSLEDNELWLRHLLGVVVQVTTALLAFLLSLPNPVLWQPAIAVFISGSWKYLERTLMLRSASMDVLRESMVTDPDPGPNYVKFMQEYASRNEAALEAKIVIESEPQPKKQLSEIQEGEDIKDTTEVIIKAYELFDTFKRLMVDLMLSFQDRIDSQYFFFERSAVQAFRVVEIELSFLYDILYTKSPLLHCRFGFAIRIFTFCVTLSAALLFHHYIRHRSFKTADVVVTYVLLVAAIVLEAVSIVVLLLSDWTIVTLQKGKHHRWASASAFVNSCLPYGNKWWSNSMCQHNLLSVCLAKRKKASWFKRLLEWLRLEKPWDNFWAFWFKCVSRALELLRLKQLWNNFWAFWFKCVSRALELLRLKQLWNNFWAFWFKCVSRALELLRLKEPWDNFWALCFKRLLELFLRLKQLWNNFWGFLKKQWDNFWGFLKKQWDNFWALWCIPRKKVPNELKELIFEELKERAQSADSSEDYKQLRACKGEWVLRQKKCTDFTWSIESREYDESVLLWHIATHLLYHTDEDHFHTKDYINTDDHDEDKKKNIATDSNANTNTSTSTSANETKSDKRKQVDYRNTCKLISDYMAYLLMMQPAMLPVGIGKIRFQDTCAEATKFFSTTEGRLNQEEACKMLLGVDAMVEPIKVKGDRSKSVLFDACRLAKQLMNDNNIKKEQRWELISAVWVELMGYAAGSCRAYIHAKQLSLGGELLTHVWLMMTHMGIGEQYRIESGHARAKLLVKK